MALSFFWPAASPAALYTGNWVNTFDASGPVEIDLLVTPNDFSATVDFGGAVFGFLDPPPVTVMGPVNGTTVEVKLFGSPIFGDITGTVDAQTGMLDILIANLPSPGTGQFIGGANVTGIFDGTVFDLDYVILFNCSGSPCLGPGMGGTEGVDFALGTIDATLVPLPASGLVLAPSLFAFAWNVRRRRR